MLKNSSTTYKVNDCNTNARDLLEEKEGSEHITEQEEAKEP